MRNIIKVKSEDLSEATSLVTRLVREEHITPEEFKLLRRLIDASSVRVNHMRRLMKEEK